MELINALRGLRLVSNHFFYINDAVDMFDTRLLRMFYLCVIYLGSTFLQILHHAAHLC